ncbi:hypothetical protein, partial [Compostibacter hankyongensis]|uniref:hypothetical protein n=1 Tax=Compostibacter hankyongensis TaxID=1007089 RepID=UPI0031E98775
MQATTILYNELDRPTITTLYNTSKTVTQLQADVDNAVSTSSVTVTQSGDPIQDLVVNHRDPGISVYKARGSITFAADAGGSFSSGAGDEFVAEIDPAATTPTVRT